MAAIKIYERLGGWRCSDEREVDLVYPLFRPWSSCYGNVENLTEVGCLNLCSTSTLAWWGKTLPGAKQKVAKPTLYQYCHLLAKTKSYIRSYKSYGYNHTIGYFLSGKFNNSTEQVHGQNIEPQRYLDLFCRAKKMK